LRDKTVPRQLREEIYALIEHIFSLPVRSLARQRTSMSL
jgi:hypothetical protein